MSDLFDLPFEDEEPEAEPEAPAQSLPAPLPGRAEGPSRRIYTVTELTVRVRDELEEKFFEVWVEGELAGGLYGVHLGGAFFAESMFHRRTNMSKVALAELVSRLRRQGFALLEVQYLTEHLAQFGVIEIPDRTYQVRLKQSLLLPCGFSE